MKIKKEVIKESLGINTKGTKTYSSKKQYIVITEEQLDKLLATLNKI